MIADDDEEWTLILLLFGKKMKLDEKKILS